MPLESWETAKSVCEWIGIVLIFCSFVSGFGALYASGKINKAQKEKLDQFELNLTTAQAELGKQQERAAKAERSLLELQSYQQPRQLTKKQFNAIQTLRGKYTAINIAYETDADSEMFASELAVALGDAGIKVVEFPRADPQHSTGGIMLYDPIAFENPNGKPTGGEPLLSTLKSVGLYGGSLQSSMSTDIKAPIEIPMIIVAGKPFPKGTPSPYLGPSETQK
jgi:hypothetical protein